MTEREEKSKDPRERYWWPVCYRCPRCSWMHETDFGEEQPALILRECPGCHYHLAVRPLDVRDLGIGFREGGFG